MLAGPIRAPARCSSSSPSWWWRAASACDSRTGRSPAGRARPIGVKQSSMRYEIPRRRGSIYDRTGDGGPRDQRRARPAGGHPKLLTPERRRARSPRSSSRSSASRAPPRPSSRPDDVRARVRDPRPRPRPGDLRPDPQRVVGDKPRSRAPARAGARPRLPAAGRRPRHDARRAPPRLRQPRRDGPVRRRAVLPGPARGHAAGRRRAEGRVRQPGARLVDRARSGLPRPGPHAHARRVAPGRGRAGAARGVDRRPRQAGLGGRDGPVHGRGGRLRELPLVRRQRLPGDRRDRARSGSSTRSCPRSTSRGRCSRCSRRPRRSGAGP